MKFSFAATTVLGICIIVLSGCAKDRALIATKTNVGLDFDTKPPTAEISIARRELAIQPSFPDMFDEETALPMLASFNLQGNFLNPSIIGHFAGGEAAVYLAKDPNDDAKKGKDDSKKGNNDGIKSSLCLLHKPNKDINEEDIAIDRPGGDSRGVLLKFWHILTGVTFEEYIRSPRRFYFATDTTFGVKVAWSGTTGPYPDSLKLGYNRKEFASPPIFVHKGCDNQKETSENVSEESKEKGDMWSIRLPSFYASISNSSAWSTIFDSEVNNVQFFATGQAATKFAERESLRQIAFENMAPKAAEIEAKALNQALIQDIKKIFEANTSKQGDILNKAIELDLVEQGVTVNNFLDELNLRAKEANYLISTRINQLRAFANP